MEVDLKGKVKGEKMERGRMTCGMVKEVGPAHVFCMGLTRTHGWLHKVVMPLARAHGWLHKVVISCVPCIS